MLIEYIRSYSEIGLPYFFALSVFHALPFGLCICKMCRQSLAWEWSWLGIYCSLHSTIKVLSMKAYIESLVLRFSLSKLTTMNFSQTDTDSTVSLLMKAAISFIGRSITPRPIKLNNNKNRT